MPSSAAHAITVALVAIAVQTPPPPAPSTGLIVGHVIDGVTGKPVAGAQVMIRLRPPTDAPPVARERPPGLFVVRVDDAGGFVFPDLAAGAHFLTATKRGYVDGAYGKLRPDGGSFPVELAAGQRLTDVTLRIWKYGSIAGTVLDEFGDPMVGIGVTALRRDWLAGHPRLVATGAGSATTDDRGMYRLGSLAAGDYIVAVPATQTTLPADALVEFSRGPVDPRSAMSQMVAPGTSLGTRENQRIGDVVLQGSPRSIITPGPTADGRLMVYPTTYYPNASASADNPAVPLAAGENKSVPAIQLRPVPTVRVTGTLTGPSGAVASTSLSLVPQSADDLSSESGFEAAKAMTDARGRFTFLGITPGQYRLRGRKGPPPVFSPGPTPPPSEPVLWLAESVSVGNQDLTLDVSLKLGFQATVRFVFDGQKPRPPIDRASVSLNPADGRSLVDVPSTIRKDQDSGTTLQGLAPGRYTISVGTPSADWSVKSVTLRGADALDTPFDVTEDLQDLVVTYTDRPARIQGSVRTNAGDGDPDALVVIFPDNPQRWVDYGRSPARLRSARPDAAGAFTFAAVPPGDYLIAAIPDASASTWRTPKFLEALSRQAVRVRLDEGATSTQALKTTRTEIR